MTDIIKEIVNWIWKFNSFLITSHEAGDGDSIGSQLALAAILKKMKKEVFIINKDPVPSMYNFLPGSENIKPELPTVNGKDWEVVMVVDCGSLERTGVVLPGKAKYINIDHHLSNEQFGDLNWVNAKASSTAEMIYRLWDAVGSIQMDLSIGDNIYTGILTDTGSFRYSNTSPECLNIAADLVRGGVQPSRIANLIYDRKSLAQLSLLGVALSNLRLTEDERVAYMYLEGESFKKYGVEATDTEGFVNYGLSMASVEVAILFKEMARDFWKMSFRSKGKVNVSVIAERFGGGGHHNAAGAKTKGELCSLWQEVFNTIYQQL